MKIKILLLLIFITTSLFSNVQEGYVNLKGYDFDKNPPVKLSGHWRVQLPGKDIELVTVPGSWKNRYGFASYAITIESSGAKNLVLVPSQINTKCKVYINGRIVARSDSSRPLFIPLDLKDGFNYIQFIIENNSDFYPGFRSTPVIGSYDQMMEGYEKSVLNDSLTAGASFIIFIFFLALFICYPKDRSTLYFSLICLFLFLRGLVINDKIIYNYIPNFPYVLSNKIEYISIYILPVLLILFKKSYFNTKWNKFSKILISLSSVLPIIGLFTTPKFYMSLLNYFYIIAMITSAYIILSIIYYTIIKKEDALKILISMLTLLVAALVDIYLIFNNTVETLFLSRVMIVFILFMSFIVSNKQIRNLLRIKRLTKENKVVNKYLHKFVPKDFIKHIGKEDITSVGLGDGVEKDMTVLFASLKGFYKQTRLLKGEQVISLLNRYLSIVSPIIIKNGGFVDKFMDETIMALFPNKPQDAIDAALEISNELSKHNSQNRREFSLKVQTGIHKGNLYMGIVGDEKRFDATVISKVVNSASRISTFTQKIDKEILISEDIFKFIESDLKYKTSYMGKVKLKGNNKSIGIYSVTTEAYNNLSVLEQQSDNLFSITMKKLENCSLSKIEDVLWKIKGMNPEHTPTLYYLKLIKENRRLEDLEK